MRDQREQLACPLLAQQVADPAADEEGGNRQVPGRLPEAVGIDEGRARLVLAAEPPDEEFRVPVPVPAAIGPLAKVKEDLIQAGVTQFGSGWCWLAVKDGKITVMKTPNGENPLVHGGKPILGCDVWEHSYYIDYRNRRPDYLKAFFEHLANWDHVGEMFEAAMK